jgi:site-specific DNA-methyltransferase (adenine-specific)
MNIDECRVMTEDILTHGGSLKPMSGEIREGKSLGMFQDGTPNTYEQNPKGRWPANLVHDGSEGVIDEFEQYGEKKSGIMRAGTKRSTDGGYHGDFPEIACLHDTYGDVGSISRFFYCAKADKGERDLGLELEEGEFMDEGREEGSPGGTNPRNRGAQTARKNFHPTVKPVALMKWLLNLVSRENSLILDPFVGSGSTLVACKKLGRKVVGIEKDPEYCKITEKRLKAPLQKTFF